MKRRHSVAASERKACSDRDVENCDCIMTKPSKMWKSPGDDQNTTTVWFSLCALTAS